MCDTTFLTSEFIQICFLCGQSSGFSSSYTNDWSNFKHNQTNDAHWSRFTEGNVIQIAWTRQQSLFLWQMSLILRSRPSDLWKWWSTWGLFGHRTLYQRTFSQEIVRERLNGWIFYIFSRVHSWLFFRIRINHFEKYVFINLNITINKVY